MGDPDKLEVIIKKKELDAIKARLHSSILYFREDDRKKMQEQFIRVYRQHYENEDHLKALLGLITSNNFLDIDNIPVLLNLSKEGQILAEKLGIGIYQDIFTFFLNLFIYINIAYEQTPIRGMRTEMNRHRIHVDEFVKFMWESQDSILTKSLHERFQSILNILNKLLNQKNIYEFIYLHLALILVGNFVNYTSLSYIDKSILINSLEPQKPLIENIFKVAELMNDKDLLLYAYICIGGFYEILEAEKAQEYYTKGLELAKEINHKFCIKKFEYLLEDTGGTPQRITIEEMKNFPIGESMQYIREFYFRDIDTIPDENHGEAKKIALKDVDPTEVLKYCKFLAVDYRPSPLGQVYGLYSLGSKFLMCLKKEIKSESFNLEVVFNHFKDIRCKDCKFKSPRSNDWVTTFGYLDEMKLKIIEIERKKYSS